MRIRHKALQSNWLAYKPLYVAAPDGTPPAGGQKIVHCVRSGGLSCFRCAAPPRHASPATGCIYRQHALLAPRCRATSLFRAARRLCRFTFARLNAFLYIRFDALSLV